MKILAICGSGIGTSMIMKTNLKKIIEKLGLEVEEINSVSLEEGKKLLNSFDLVIASEKLLKELGENPKIKPLKNLLDIEELESILKSI